MRLSYLISLVIAFFWSGTVSTWGDSVIVSLSIVIPVAVVAMPYSSAVAVAGVVAMFVPFLWVWL